MPQQRRPSEKRDAAHMTSCVVSTQPQKVKKCRLFCRYASVDANEGVETTQVKLKTVKCGEMHTPKKRLCDEQADKRTVQTTITQ